MSGNWKVGFQISEIKTMQLLCQVTARTVQGCLTCELVGGDKRGGVPGPASDVVPGKAVTRYEASLPLSPS